MEYVLILSFWFANQSNWFNKSNEFDEEIRQNFLLTFEDAYNGKLDHWQEQPESMLTLIIILDQFSRNMFRNSPKAFSADSKALSLTKKALNLGFDKQLNNEQKRFLFMPLMHSENLEDQELCVKLFEQLHDELSLKFAIALLKGLIAFHIEMKF